MNLYGGALQVHYLLRGLASVEETTNVLVCPNGSAIAKAAGENTAALYSVPMSGDVDLLFIPRLTAIIKKEKPDILHLHSRRGADILGGVAARMTGKPCILTRRVDNPENRLWARVKYPLYQKIIAISEGIRQVLISSGVPPGDITCVHSAVDASRFSYPHDTGWFREEFGIREKEIVCGVVAQFIERKGHKYLLEAIPAIASRSPGIRFLLFGKGPLEGELKTTCQGLGISERVVFAGFREDLERVMGCLDLLVHPALMEGLGVSLLQAAAAGVPIVGTRVGGIPEIVHDGVNGHLVPPGNAPSLVDAVTRIIEDRDLARQMGDAGREIVKEHFSIDSMVEGNLEVYREVMKEKCRVQGSEK